MKCPKCGYNSFEFHDTCKKCSSDLTGFKGTHGLQAIILPLEARTAMAKTLLAAAAAEQGEKAVAETSDMFSFDLPEEEPAAAAAAQSDPFGFVNAPSDSAPNFGEFSFDEEPAQPQAAPQAAPEEDAFASLLESSPSGNASPFAASPPPPPTPEPKPAATSTPGEFDLDSFSWDEPATQADGEKKAVDDFDSLFGDSGAEKK